ncbi:MAG: dUTP diphosphatase [Bdellovibrionales bacterium]|jgi:dUTP pyrophosphatase|nr:dUTP diphosphatase [Bdellovibrionales bacterium]
MSQGFMKVPLKIKTLPHFRGELPRYETVHASGLDVRAALSEPVVLKPMERTLIPTGISMEIPPGFEVQMRPRSGLAAKQGLTLLNTPGTIDADYRGEVKMIVVNLGLEPIEIKDQDRIAQMVLCPVVQADLQLVPELSDTVRGVGGFGSTGVRA